VAENPGPDQARLLDAVVALGAELDLGAVLRRIVTAAVELVGARYGVLGVVAEDGPRFDELVQVGLDDGTVPAMGAFPTYCGVLDLAVDEPMRLADVAVHPHVSGFPPGHPRMRAFLAVPIRVRGTVFGNLYLTEKTTAAEFSAEDERIAHALATAAGIAVQNARLYERSRHRAEWLRAASEVTRLLLSGADDLEVFTAIAGHVRDLSGASDAAVFLPRGGELKLVAGVGDRAADRVGLTVDAERSLVGSVFRDSLAANLNAAEVARAPESNPDAPPSGPSLLVPLSAAGHTRGVLVASRPPGAQPFPGAAVAAVEGLAEQAELAYELAQRRRDGEALSLFADRDRIARNLHDLVIQRLFATGMALETAANLVGVRPAEARERVRRAVGDLDTTIKEIRTTVFALQQPLDRSSSLRSRIIEIVDSAAVTLGFAPSLRFDGLIDTLVGEEPAEHLLAVLREALSNVARHAEATAVRVQVSVHDRLVARVSDNGIGIGAAGQRAAQDSARQDPAAQDPARQEPGRHRGLTNMAARAEELGGELTVGDAGPGTVLTWSVPLVS